MATKKTPVQKAPAKRKPRAKQPPATADATPRWDRWLTFAMQSLLMLGLGAAGGWWASRGVEIGPRHDDVLQQSYDRDRVTQVAVLRELAEQPFDGATDDGRLAAGTFFNAQRFRNRAMDFADFTDRVAVAIAENAEAELAADLEDELESK